MEPVTATMAIVSAMPAVISALKEFWDWLAGLFGSTAGAERRAKRATRDASRVSLHQVSVPWPSSMAPPSWTGRDTSRTMAMQDDALNTIIDPGQGGTWLFPRYTEGTKELDAGTAGAMIFVPDGRWGIEERPYRMNTRAR